MKTSDTFSNLDGLDLKDFSNLDGLGGWTSTLCLNRRTRLLAVFYLIKKIDVNSIYKVIDVYVYLDVM